MESFVGSDPSFHPFPRLPYELRLDIIEKCLGCPKNTKEYEKIHDRLPYGRVFYVRGRRNRLVDLATVDMEWKSVVEKCTFRALSLRIADINNPHDLDDLERICVEDRINAVSSIHLSIYLDNRSSRHTDSSNGTMSLSNNEASNADIENAINQSTQHAERVATAAFGQLFRILKNWSRDSQPLSFTYDFFCQGLRKSRPLIGTHLRIDSSSFPEVACIGSLKMSEGHDWGIHPESTFQLLTRLPNAKQATMTFEDELESAEIIQSVEEGHATASFQKLKLEALYLESVSMWKRRRDPGLHIHPSLQLSQSVSAMASRLEELYISHVVDVPYFLSQAWGAGQTTPHGSPAWPNMRILCLRGHSMWASSESPAYAAELYDSVTKALPQLPNITRFDITIESPYYSFGRWDWLNTIVYMEIPPRGYPPAMQDGMLLAGNVGLDAETVDTWKQIARSQWYCELVPFQ